MNPSRFGAAIVLTVLVCGLSPVEAADPQGPPIIYTFDWPILSEGQWVPGTGTILTFEGFHFGTTPASDALVDLPCAPHLSCVFFLGGDSGGSYPATILSWSDSEVKVAVPSLPTSSLPYWWLFSTGQGKAEGPRFRVLPSQCDPSAPSRTIEVDFNGNICTGSDLGSKTFLWGTFGQQDVLVAKNGDKLAVRCDPVSDNLVAFVLYFTPANGTLKQPIGMCPFQEGCNSFYLKYSVGSAGSASQPGCFLKSLWVSRDYGDNDGGILVTKNHWTGESPENPETLDWAVSKFDFTNKILDREVLKFYYSSGDPPVAVGACLGDPDEPIPERGGLRDRFHVNPPAWPPPVSATSLSSAVTAPRTMTVFPMMGAAWSLSDLNRDGKVDMSDFLLFRKAFGSCTSQPNYNIAADLDLDGCVTFEDYQIWLDLYNAKK